MNDIPTEDPVAGRTCPLHYRYLPEVFASAATTHLSDIDVLYVVGGLYGNESALDRVLESFDREAGRKRLVFNGDFHWFDADPDIFERVQRKVLAHTALRGNVETELSVEVTGDADDFGCGCAYPDWVGDQVVERSNRILARLRQAVTPAQRQSLAALPMWLRANVGALRLGIVHGDAQSLAGWGFAQEHLLELSHRDIARGWFDRGQVDAFACTHTCLPVFQSLRASDGNRSRWIFNNGATGMPNFSGDGSGLFTRVAVAPFSGPQRRFGVKVDEVFVDAVAVDASSPDSMAAFTRQWPVGTDAHESYFERIARGPSYQVSQAVRYED